MADVNPFFAPQRRPCRHHGTSDLLPAASEFLQSELYTSKCKVVLASERKLLHNDRLKVHSLNVLQEVQADAAPFVRYDEQFAVWQMELRANFSVILYGMGCKRGLLSLFAAQCLIDGGLVEVNVWRGKVTAKQILMSVLSSLCGIPVGDFRSMSTEAMVNRIAAEEGSGMWVNVVIHSLDGRCLRQHDEHAALSRLAACRAVRMVASVDHPDTSLMHGFVAAQQFQACWHHVPTLLPLWNETWEIEPCVQARQSSEVHLDAIPVLLTLTQNSQHVFCTLVTVLLGEILTDEDEVPGVSYEHLFRVCRERLLVSSDETLKAHLTEYKDHDLLKRRKTPDGAELLYVPLPVVELQRLHEVLQGSIS